MFRAPNPAPRVPSKRMAKRARSKPGRPESKARRSDRPSPAPSATPPAAPAPPPLPAPDAHALSLFQQAMEALHRRHFDIAARQFRTVLERYPGERALLDRTRVYLERAERELNRRPAVPRTVEERLTAATAALNNDQDAEAEQLVRAVLADDPRHDLALYLMAAIEARRGDQDAALNFLGRAIAASPEVRAQARHDSDFEMLRGLDAFQQLVEPPTPPALPRKPRRHR